MTTRGPSGHVGSPHTADLRIEACAPTPEECVAEPVGALVESFADCSSDLPTLPVECVFSAGPPIRAVPKAVSLHDLRLRRGDAYRLRIEPPGRMRVPGIVFASRTLVPDSCGDKALEQVANVATLSGIVAASYAMPDVHWGYGFPIGGVATTDVAVGGVVKG